MQIVTYVALRFEKKEHQQLQIQQSNEKDEIIR